MFSLKKIQILKISENFDFLTFSDFSQCFSHVGPPPPPRHLMTDHDGPEAHIRPPGGTGRLLGGPLARLMLVLEA